MNIAVQVAGISAGPEPRVSLGVSTDTGVSFGCDVVIDWNAPAAQMETDIITRVTAALADFGVTVMPGDQRRILGDGATNLDSLQDVAISSPAAGHGLRYRGTSFVNEADYATIAFVIDGGTTAITPGVKGDLEVPFDCYIERVTLLADQTGSIVVDIWRDTYANYPPTNADSITSNTRPTISSGSTAQDSTLSSWTRTLAAGDILRFNVESGSALTRVLVSLRVRKT